MLNEPWRGSGSCVLAAEKLPLRTAERFPTRQGFATGTARDFEHLPTAKSPVLKIQNRIITYLNTATYHHDSSASVKSFLGVPTREQEEPTVLEGLVDLGGSWSASQTKYGKQIPPGLSSEHFVSCTGQERA